MRFFISFLYFMNTYVVKGPFDQSMTIHGSGFWPLCNCLRQSINGRTLAGIWQTEKEKV